MTEFISEIKTIPYNENEVFEKLSDLTHLEELKDRIPIHQVTEFSFDRDSFEFTVSPVGKVKFSIVERHPNNTLKLSADQSPIGVSMWIQLKQIEEGKTAMKLTVQAQLNPLLKPMLSKPLQDGVNKMAEILAVIPYST